MLAATSHNAFFETVAQVIPVILVVLAFERTKSFWGPTESTFSAFGGLLLISATIGETLALIQLWGPHSKGFTTTCVWIDAITLAALALGLFVAVARPRAAGGGPPAGL